MTAFLQKYYLILIFIVILITTRHLHELNRYQRTSRNGVVAFSRKVVLKRYITAENCQEYWFKLPFELKNCGSYQVGETLKILGRVEGDFDKKNFNQKRLVVQSISRNLNISVSGKYLFFTVLNSAIEKIQRSRQELVTKLGKTRGGIVSGLVFGGSSQLPPDVKQDLQVAGLQHVTSASGYNVSLFAGLLSGAMLPLSRVLPRTFLQLLLIGGLIFYLVVAGFPASLVRAVLMATYSLLAKMFHRPNFAFYSLVLSSAIMIFLNPWYISDVGFQFSSGATLGIVLFLGHLSHDKTAISRSDQPLTWQVSLVFLERVKESFLGSVAAQAFITPLLVHYFGKLSVLSLVSNVIVGWLIPFLTLLCLFYFLALMTFPLLADIILFCLWPGIEIFLQIIRFFGLFPSSVIEVKLSWMGVIVWWVIVGGMYLYLRRRTTFRNVSSHSPMEELIL